MNIPNRLIEIKNFLIREGITLSSHLRDGRLNSSFNEEEVINKIKAIFAINEPNSRQWFDFSFEENNLFYPVNIKVTTTTTADNLNCKLGIYYALTGMLPDFPNEINYLRYFEKLSDNIGTYKDKDYYFLIINKNNPKEVIINTLRGITTLRPNGNNLPFQCKWNDNKEIENRTFDESKDFILSKFGESIKLRADVYFNFKRFFRKYV